MPTSTSPQQQPSLPRSAAIASAVGAQFQEDFTVIAATTLTLKQKDTRALGRVAGVQYVSPNGNLAQPSAFSLESEFVDQFEATNLGSYMAIGTAPDTSKLLTMYPLEVHADAAWKSSAPITGKGVVVAMLDTGINEYHADMFQKEASFVLNPVATGHRDGNGHGTHVAGIIGGRDPAGHYVGIAPDVKILSVKIADDKGSAVESDMLRGMQWVLDHHVANHIKAVNISMTATIPTSYRSSPLDAAVERLWQAGITVITAAGNYGSAGTSTWYAPGNDPFAISVGCLDDAQTLNTSDDSLCSFSSRGSTLDGVAKPDVVAPGRKIMSTLAGPKVQLAIDFPTRIASDGQHLRMSGTSMATPMVTGAAALMFQRASDSILLVKQADLGVYRAKQTRNAVVRAGTDATNDGADQRHDHPSSALVTRLASGPDLAA